MKGRQSVEITPAVVGHHLLRRAGVGALVLAILFPCCKAPKDKAQPTGETGTTVQETLPPPSEAAEGVEGAKPTESTAPPPAVVEVPALKEEAADPSDPGARWRAWAAMHSASEDEKISTKEQVRKDLARLRLAELVPPGGSRGAMNGVHAALRETAALVTMGQPAPAPKPVSMGSSSDVDSALLALANQVQSRGAASSAAVPPSTPEPKSTTPPVTRSGPSPQAQPPAEKKEPPKETKSAPPAKQKPDTPPVTRSAPPPQEPPKPEPVKRPSGVPVLKTLFHKSAVEFVGFMKEMYPDLVEKGHVSRVAGEGRTVVIFGEKPGDPNDAIIQKISDLADRYDDLELKLETRVIRPRYAPLTNVMDAMVMRGYANVWYLIEEADELTWKEGNKTRKVSRKLPGYMQGGMVKGAVAPISLPSKIPYIYEMPSMNTFDIPPHYSGRLNEDKTLVNFVNTSSTEERNVMVAVGTKEDLDRIQEFVDTIDVPARRIMIEVEVIELEANKLLDLGFDSAQAGSGHHIVNLGLPLPGEPIVQPGLGEDVRRDPDQFVPQILSEGLELIYDDTTIDLSGRFLFTLHALVREGDATVKARPKILTLDDRTSVLHLGRELPSFTSTAVTRDSVDGNLISEVRGVTMQYVGITLNLRPRVTGGADEEVSLQVEVIANELVDRQRVFEEDLLGIPAINKRHYIGENRVRNHRPIILGGLIQEQEVESVNKIPLLADIPLLGYLFRRTQKASSRREIILVITPHILSDKGVDRAGTPKESVHFDTYDSVLFNDRHVIKGSDVLGVDPIKNAPAPGFERDQIVDLTLLNIVRKRELVSKLHVLEDYLGDEIDVLSWIQRKWPESTVPDWDKKEQELYFRAAAICIDNIKELNYDLTFEELILPRREIILPTSPYKISLSYDRVKYLQEQGLEYVFRGERVELDQGFVNKLKDASGYSLGAFGEYLGRRDRKPEEHGALLQELKILYSGLNPDSEALAGVSYPEIYRELEKAGLNFISLATFFQTNLQERYETSGRPDVGMFQKDLEGFVRTSLSLVERARDLMELEEKWRMMNEPEEKKEGEDL